MTNDNIVLAGSMAILVIMLGGLVFAAVKRLPIVAMVAVLGAMPPAFAMILFAIGTR